MSEIEVRCNGEITIFRGLCPKRLECSFYKAYLDNLGTPFSQVILKKEKVGKDYSMKCFKPLNL